MRILVISTVVICTMAFAIAGGLLIALAFNLFTGQYLIEFLAQIFEIQSARLAIGGVGLLLIIASVCVAQITLGKMSKEKTIAFNNPEGRVTVSLSAIEDFIRRLSSNMMDIKDLRSNVIAGKKGIEINARVSLWADVNIPQATSSIQAIIKNRVQEMLGIEEPILVKVHVGKIIQKEKKRPKKKEEEAEKISPFRGSIEYGKD